MQKLEAGVNTTDKKKGQLHQVFEPSFDCKWCYDDKLINQKLDYMHGNPCRGKWQLCINPAVYIHSSAKFYLTGKQGVYPVTSWIELMDTNLTVPHKRGQ